MKNVFTFLLLLSLSMATAQELVIENPPFSVQKTKLPKQALKALKIKDDKKPLQTPVWKYGEALLKGQFLGYRPDLNYQVEVYVDDPVLGIQSEYKTTLSEDGAYTIKIPLPTTLSVLFRVTIAENNIFYNNYILLSPDKTTELYVDLYQKFCQEGRLGSDKCQEAQYMIFTGANADINNQMNRPEIVRFYESFNDFEKFMKDIVGMTLEEYKSYMMKHLNDAVVRIPEFRLTRKAAEFLKLSMVYYNMYNLMLANSMLEFAYRRANNIKNNEPSIGFIRPLMDLDYYSFIKEIPMNDPVSLYCNNYGYNINACKYIDDYKVWSNMVSIQQMQERSRNERKQALATIIGTDKGIAFDLMETQMIAEQLKDFKPLSVSDLEALSDLPNPFFAQYMKLKNEELIAQIEERKSNPNYRVHQLDETEDEKILSSILQQFEGKVVLIDFWETWCGPCLNAMKQFEPFKEGLMEKGIVFLYLSSASSPVSAWNNMIPTIKGEHYRLTYQQMGYLQKKYGIIGVPAYMIIDKAGEQIYFRVGFEGAPAMTNRLNQALQAM